MNSILEYLSQVVTQYPIVSPFISLVAGMLSAFLPCSLAALPLIIGYLAGERQETRRNVVISVFYACGNIVVFTIFGIVASLFGKILNQNHRIFQMAIGILLILMAIQVWNIFVFIPAKIYRSSMKKGLFGAFLAGCIQGVFSSPCSTPFIVSLFALASISKNILFSVLLFVSYAIGNSILILTVAFSMGKVGEFMSGSNYQKLSQILEFVFGLFLFGLGLMLIYQAI